VSVGAFDPRMLDGSSAGTDTDSDGVCEGVGGRGGEVGDDVEVLLILLLLTLMVVGKEKFWDACREMTRWAYAGFETDCLRGADAYWISSAT
jgi:hypothetical protein